MTETPQTPSGPGWYDDPHDPLLLRYFDGVLWTAHTTPRESPTAGASVIGGATPGTFPGDPGSAGGWRHPGRPAQPGPPTQSGPPAPWQQPGQWQGGQMPPSSQYGGAYGQGWAPQRKDVLPDGAVLAEWWRRLLGRIIDIVITSIITLIVAAPWLGDLVGTVSDYISASVRAAESGGAQPDQGAFASQLATLTLPVTIAGIVVSLVYEVAFLTTKGATPGKMLLGTVVRRVGGPGRLTVLDALKRQAIAVATSIMGLLNPIVSLFGTMLSILDPAWLLWDPKRQCLHDKLADTVVVMRVRSR